MRFALKDKVYQGLGNVVYLERHSLTDLLLAVSLMTAEMRPAGREGGRVDERGKSRNRGQNHF